MVIVFPYNAIHNASLSVVRRMIPIRLEKRAAAVKCSIRLRKHNKEKKSVPRHVRVKAVVV